MELPDAELHRRLANLNTCTTGLRIEGLHAMLRVIDTVRQYDAEHDVDDIVVLMEPTERRKVRAKVVGRRNAKPLLCAEDFA